MTARSSTGLGRIRVHASTETLNWIDWLREHTGLNSSRQVEKGIQTLVLIEAERIAGRRVVTMNPDGSDARDLR